MEKISILIPFLNEAENVEWLVLKLNQFCEANSQLNFEVIFIDDGSTDGTSEKLIQIKEVNRLQFSAKIIKLSKNYGSHSALRAGLEYASGSFISFLYADLQDPPELIIKLYNECQKGNTIAWACRNNTSNAFLETMYSRIYARLMRKFATSLYPEQGFDVVMFNQTVCDILKKHPEAHSSLFLQILTLGFQQSFISYDKQERKRGTSKWTFAKKVKLFIDSFVAFSYAPIRFVTLMGILMFNIGLLWSAYLVLRVIFSNDLVSGWPTLMSVLLLGFGLTNISLGILAEYLWRIFDVARKRPVYIIENIIEVN